MKAANLVSVVIATYNRSKYLPVAIRSVLQQTYSNFEIHVVDDGSTDDTPIVMRQFATNHAIRYHRQNNGGQAKAKNVGIKEAKGDYVAFLDADDMWVSDKLEKQLPCFENSPNVGVVYTNVQCIDEEGHLLPTPSRAHYTGRITGPLLIDNFVTGMASIVRKECFEEVGVFDESLPMGIDYDLWLRISVKYEFAYLNHVTYLYRQWPGQMSHNHSKRYECAVAIMSHFLEKNPGLVERRIVNRAWAHTYVGRGESLITMDNSAYEAFKYYLKALKVCPAYVPAWKQIVKLLLR